MDATMIWTEKYRPATLKDIIGQPQVIPRLSAFIGKKTLPHCLFAGPAGCGKTTAALAIAREFYGDAWQSNFLELNASDERGIDTIRVKVKDFARTVSLSGTFKIIYLDEADSLTKDAQHALRRTMEKYSHTTRFILSCNYSSRIIPPIQSRCAIFRFSPLRQDDIAGYLKYVAGKEQLPVRDDAYAAILHVAEGDLRRAINILQGAAVLGQDITSDVVYAATGKAQPDAVRTMIASAIDGKFREARAALIGLMHEQGLAGEDIIREIHNQVLDLPLPDEKKLALIEKVGEYEFRLTEGSNPRLQLEALLAQFGAMKK